jgi:glutathione S-transferase
MAFGLKAINYDPPADKQPMFGHGSHQRCFSALEQMLAGRDYATGRFSAADLYLSSQLGFMLTFGLIEGTPTLRDYVARCQDREAYRRAKQLDAEAAEAMSAQA